jgi:lysophospholipase
VTTLARPVGLGGRVVPTSSPENYLLAANFDDNMLTTDREMFSWMQEQLRAHPELALGGPSIAWVNEALREVRALRRMSSPDLPGLCVVGENERIVDIADMRARMSTWAGGRLVLEPGAEHELMMERPEVRERFFDAAAEMFDQAASVA